MILSIYIIFKFYSLLDTFYSVSFYKKVFFTVLLAMNPILLYNTLTVKQYTFDVISILFLWEFILSIIYKKWNNQHNWLMIAFLFLSNIYVFHTLVLVLSSVFFRKNFYVEYKKQIYLYFSGFIVFIFYYLFYSSQINFIELKRFMFDFWFPNHEFSIQYFMIRIIHMFKVIFKIIAISEYGFYALLFLTPIFIFIVLNINKKFIQIKFKTLFYYY